MPSLDISTPLSTRLHRAFPTARSNSAAATEALQRYLFIHEALHSGDEVEDIMEELRVIMRYWQSSALGEKS